ncbi:conjugal transfer protein TrbH [Salmonella enterica]|nr:MULTISPECIES: conjugal transfer protein TrbH [Enterobacteriaceae]EAO5102657.1 conjugal transfer protein TrbH [Salmonella enterica]EBS0352113.1 conjugal transfer protein TrbH [Salmonella enterica subsp. enterica serovar Java]EBW7170416.1 conjugal transfer protein TrbH [Salmonella enterica subsp. enterica serovar Javiana]ECD7684174.1 conjugal transfer protein TrbH [Salmonella enterica subsp. enterica serovar Typhimurium]ECM3357607.1 conjugal transfer protein TrbH [Salmonella enterica subsp. e
MARFQLMATLAAALLLSACATSRPTMSYVEPSVTATDSITLSREAVAYLADALPPARTTLVLDPPAAKDQDHLTAALLPALRARGYGVTLADPKTGRPAGQGVALRYLASPLDGGVLMRLQYQGTEASRFYPRGTNGLLLPGAPFTVRGGQQ